MATQEERILKKQRERRRGSSTPNSPQARAPSTPVNIRGIPTFASAVGNGDPIMRPPPDTPATRRPTQPTVPPNVGRQSVRDGGDPIMRPPPQGRAQAPNSLRGVPTFNEAVAPRPEPAQQPDRQDILRQLNTDALNLDSAEVRARRAAGETNPVGSAELAASEGNIPGGSNRFRDSLEGLPDKIPAQLAADILKDRGISVSVQNGRLVMPDNIGEQLGPEGSAKRALMQEIAFRAPGAAMFAEEAGGPVPTFNNQSIRRREQAGMMPDFRALEQLERDRRAARPVSENANRDRQIAGRTEEQVQNDAETERLERESILNSQVAAATARSRSRSGRNSESGVSLFSRASDGGFVPNDLTPKQVNSIAAEEAPGIAAELQRTPAIQEQLSDGSLTPEQLQQNVQAEFGSFVKRYMDEAEDADRLPFLSEQALADAFVIGRAVEAASGGEVRALTPTELVTTVEDLIATQEKGFLGFGSDKSRTGGRNIKHDDLGSGAGAALRRLESEMIRQAEDDPNSQVRQDIQAQQAQKAVDESRAQDVRQTYDQIRQRNMQRDENFARAMMPGFAEDFFDAPGGPPDVRTIVEGVNQYNPFNRLLFEPVANAQSRLTTPDSPRTTQARENLRRIAMGEDEN